MEEKRLAYLWRHVDECVWWYEGVKDACFEKREGIGVVVGKDRVAGKAFNEERGCGKFKAHSFFPAPHRVRFSLTAQETRGCSPVRRIRKESRPDVEVPLDPPGTRTPDKLGPERQPDASAVLVKGERHTDLKENCWSNSEVTPAFNAIRFRYVCPLSRVLC